MRCTRLALLLPMLASCGSDVSVGQRINLEPTAAILAPDPGLPYVDDEMIQFRGVVSDPNGLSDLADVYWSSSIDGTIGSPQEVEPDSGGRTEFSALLTQGTHVITLTAVDQGGLRASDSLTLTVGAADQAPSVTIESPADFSQIWWGDTATLIGVVSDPQQSADTLSVEWAAITTEGLEFRIPSGAPSSSGVTTTTWTPELTGRYTLRLRAIDDEGNVGSDQITFLVDDPDMVDWDGDGFTVAGGDCDDTDATVYPGAPEACNNKDNDCNGVTDDKDFDLDGYIDIECVFYDGGLPTGDCNDADADVFPGNVEACNSKDSDCNGYIDDKDLDLDGHVDELCTFNNSPLPTDDCDDTDSRINPSAVDDPDLDYIDTNCDGIDGDIDRSVFVDPATGDDSRSGTSPFEPVRTVHRAYAIASSTGRDWILMSGIDQTLSGNFDEGVSLAGGYLAHADWDRDPASEAVFTNPSASGRALDRWTTPTTFQQLRIASPGTGTAGASSIALTVSRSIGVNFESVAFEAGNAGHGISGTGRSRAPNGRSGGGGQNGVRDSSGFCPSNPRPQRGAGGLVCGSGGHAGGIGGWSGHPAKGTASAGARGGGPGGTGGSAGVSNGQRGGNGNPGAPGSAGASGAGGSSVGLFSTSGYFPSNGLGGLAGTAGTAGGGGGGGGPGGWTWGNCDTWGGAGGGGGSGGCGGQGGDGGGGGGASIGLLLIDSNVRVELSHVTTGRGGNGGAGGAGGEGGDGGSGGSGGSSRSSTAGQDSGAGGNGGTGGSGGQGGHGGGGGGGPSLGVVCGDGSTLDISGTTYSLGAGGTGGASPGDRGETGARSPNHGC